MKLTLKPGVVIKEINTPLCHTCYSVWYVWRQYGVDNPVMTSANDGKHMDGSLHYQNLAWDFRIWGLSNPQEVVSKLKEVMNAKRHDYDVLLEGDHVHVEFDPKETKP